MQNPQPKELSPPPPLSTAPSGESFPLPAPDDYAAEFKRLTKLAVRHNQYTTITPDDLLAMTNRPVAVIDCFGMLDDTAIARYFELGCEVKGLGRGHVKRIKDRVKDER